LIELAATRRASVPLPLQPLPTTPRKQRVRRVLGDP
jgi:hypothetical protein